MYCDVFDNSSVYLDVFDGVHGDLLVVWIGQTGNMCGFRLSNRTSESRCGGSNIICGVEYVRVHNV